MVSKEKQEGFPEKRNSQWYSEKFSQLRAYLKLSQAALGEKLGVSGAAIGQLERGESKSPSADLLGALASMLSVNLDWLLNGEGEMLKSPPLLEAGLKNNSVSGAKADIDPRLLTGDVSMGKRPAFNYPVQSPAPSKESPKTEAKQVLGNLVEQLDRNTSEIEQLRAAVRDIQQQLKS